MSLPKKSVGKKLTTRTKKPTTLEDRLIQIAALRRRAAAINNKIAEQQDILLAEMEERELDKVEVENDVDGTHITGVRVQATKVDIDETALKKRAGASVWAKITRRQLDKKLLESAIQSGLVREVDLADSSTVSKNKPFVKVTVK